MAVLTSLVHSIETTAPFFPESYQAHLLADNSGEFLASLELYESIPSDPRFPRHESLANCRKFAWFCRGETSGIVRISSNHCRLRWCPLCSDLKAFFVKKSCQQWLEQVAKPKLLTLTLKHSQNPLRNQIQDLYSFFQAFRRRKWIKAAISGGIWFFQITFEKKTGLWHPHLHVLLDAEYMEQKNLSEEWRAVTHGSFVVDIRRIWNPEKAAQHIAAYVARPMKLASLTLSQRQIVYEALAGRRLAGAWGTGRKIKLSGEQMPEEEKFVKIASWRTVKKTHTTDSRARAIIRAWRSGKPLQAGIDLLGLERFVDGDDELDPLDFDMEKFKDTG